MTQDIDQEKLRYAAEHLEWVLLQYPHSAEIKALLEGLKPLIEDAKSGRIGVPLDKIPFEYNFADGVYVAYKDPSVGTAFAAFAVELAGGLTEEDKQRIARMDALRRARNAVGGVP